MIVCLPCLCACAAADEPHHRGAVGRLGGCAAPLCVSLTRAPPCWCDCYRRAASCKRFDVCVSVCVCCRRAAPQYEIPTFDSAFEPAAAESINRVGTTTTTITDGRARLDDSSGCNTCASHTERHQTYISAGGRRASSHPPSCRAPCRRHACAARAQGGRRQRRRATACRWAPRATWRPAPALPTTMRLRA